MSYRPSLLTKGFLIPATLLIPLSVSLAAEISWDNAGTGLFTEGTNWDTDTVPTDTDDAFIANGGTAQLQADEFVSVNVLRVQNGAVELNNAILNTGITSNSWQGPGDLQLGGNSGESGSLTASGTSSISTGRVRVGGWNDAGTDMGDVHGTLTMSGESTLTTANGDDFWLGSGAGSTAALDMSGTTSRIDVNNTGTAGRNGATATATQAGGSTFATTGGFAFGENGTATWTVKDEATLRIGGQANIAQGGNGTITVQDSATFETTGSGVISVGQGGTGVLNVQGGATVTSGGEFWIGNNTTGDGTVNLSGGSITTGSWVVVGRNPNTGGSGPGKGTLNVSGGTFTKGGGGNFVTHGSASLVATINHTGGEITNTGSETWLSEGSENVTAWTASAGTGNFGDFQVGRGGNATVTLSGTADYTATTVRLGVNGTGAGVLSLNGGRLTADSISKVAGSGTVNLNGGVLRAGADNADFVAGFQAGDVVIQGGGAIIDTNSFNVEITLSLSGSGGLAKIGDGVLTLSGENTYGGDTAVTDGTLSITSGFLSDTANVSLGDGTTFDLNFSGNDTVKGLIIGGEGMAIGTWGSLTSDAEHKSALFTGTGVLMVTTVVPEPSTVALVALGLGMAGWRLRRRR